MDLNTLKVTILAITFISLLPFVAKMNANNLKNSNMQIKLNSKTRENTVLVGRAGNYIFFWNKMDESTEILNESEVKTLIINSFQKKNTSFLDAFSRDE